MSNTDTLNMAIFHMCATRVSEVFSPPIQAHFIPQTTVRDLERISTIVGGDFYHNSIQESICHLNFAGSEVFIPRILDSLPQLFHVHRMTCSAPLPDSFTIWNFSQTQSPVKPLSVPESPPLGRYGTVVVAGVSLLTLIQ